MATATYRLWQNLKRRKYQKYYAGIDICEKWRMSYEAFLADMGEIPEGLTIDRIDNSKGYEPGNCRWANRHEQAENRRSSVMLTVNNETHCLAYWARKYGLNYATLRHRIIKGMDVEQALTTPLLGTR
jgi:hypothetical protein